MPQPRSVFITGASSGIGRALALEYARQGARVGIAARRESELEQVARDIRALGATAFVYPLDVTNADAVRETVRKAEGDLRGLDMVIANAGIGISGHASTLTFDDLQRVMDVNVSGQMATLMAAMPIMVAQRRGHLVAITSLAGRRGLPGYGAYPASKAAMSAFLDTLRIDLSDSGVFVTDVRPGFIETPLVERHEHKLPFVMPVDKASRLIVKRLKRRPAAIEFPWQLAALATMGRMLPAKLFDPIARLIAKNSAPG